MIDIKDFFRKIRRHPERFYLIHYSSQGLYEDTVDGLSPRITSIVVMHYSTRQTISFATHTIAESLSIQKEQILQEYDKVEKELLERFYQFIRDRREKYWVHWNMRNINYGFEHIEHRYRILCHQDPPHIPVEVRQNLSDIFKDKYGNDYATDPKLKGLMLLNGPFDTRFLEGAEEAEAFRRQEFIRMNASTISKVEFFRHAINLSQQGRLRVLGKGIIFFFDRLLESRSSRAAALCASAVGIPVGVYQLFLWFQ